MYNVTVTTEIRKLDGTAFSKNDQVWSNMPYEGILLLQKVGLEGLSPGKSPSKARTLICSNSADIITACTRNSSGTSWRSSMGLMKPLEL